jgi:hypothetical protein
MYFTLSYTSETRTLRTRPANVDERRTRAADAAALTVIHFVLYVLAGIAIGSRSA